MNKKLTTIAGAALATLKDGQPKETIVKGHQLPKTSSTDATVPTTFATMVLAISASINNRRREQN